MKLLSSFKVILILNFFFNIGSVQGLKPPDIIWNEGREVYSAEFVDLACDVIENNVEKFTWLKNGKEAIEGVTSEEGGKKLKVDVSKTNGYFQCKAENGLGTALSDSVFVGQTIIPKKQIIKQNITVKEGEYKALKCLYVEECTPRPEVVWQKNDINIVESSRMQVDDQGTLHITHILKDDGIESVKNYTCTLKEKGGYSTRKSTSYTIIVQGMATEEREITPRYITKSPITGIRGSSITMRCIFSGAKDLNVEWFNSKDNKVEGNDIIPGKGSSITINNLKNSDAGKYKCRVTHNGKVKEEIIEIIVNDVPGFLTENDSPKNIYGTTGSSAQFVCNPTSNPPPKIEWFKNGKLLDRENLDAHIGISSDQKILTISQLCRECGKDAVFQCNASNAFGYVYKNAFLKIYDATKISVKPVDVEFEENKNFTFKCEATTDVETNLDYEWQFNDKTVNIGSIKTKQQNLFLNTDVLKASNIEFVGKWTCIATNGYSTDKADAHLFYKIIPAFAQWWILVLVLLIILLLALIIGCVCNTIYKNRGSVYPVDEIEHKNGNDPEKELLEYGFHDYQRDVTISTSGTLRSQRSMGSTNSLARA